VVFRVLKSSKTMNSDDFAIDLALGNESVPLKMPPVSRVAAPDSIWSVDPDPYSESGSGSRRAKMIHKSKKKFKKFHVLKGWMFFFES
jgi:hypothetical protein